MTLVEPTADPIWANGAFPVVVDAPGAPAVAVTVGETTVLTLLPPFTGVLDPGGIEDGTWPLVVARSDGGAEVRRTLHLDRKPPELIGAAPPPAVWLPETAVQFNFSEPVLLDEVSATLDGRPWRAALVAAPDGATWTLNLPREGTDLRLALSGRDLAGNTFGPADFAAILSQVVPIAPVALPDIAPEALTGLTVHLDAEDRAWTAWVAYDGAQPAAWLRTPDGEVQPVGQGVVRRVQLVTDRDGASWIAWQGAAERSKDLDYQSVVYLAPLNALSEPRVLPLRPQHTVLGFEAVTGLGDSLLEVAAVTTDGTEAVVQTVAVEQQGFGSPSTFPWNGIVETACQEGLGCAPARAAKGEAVSVAGEALTGRWAAVPVPASLAPSGHAEVQVYGERAADQGWVPVGEPLRRFKEGRIEVVALAARGDTPVVAWLEQGAQVQGAFVARLVPEAGQWAWFSGDLQATEGGTITDLSLGKAPDGTLVLHTLEVNGKSTRRRTHRLDAEESQPTLADTVVSEAVLAGLAVAWGPAGKLLIALPLASGTGLQIHLEVAEQAGARLVGVPPRLAEATFEPEPNCQLGENPPAEGSWLSETGCYVDIARKEVRHHAVPYELNASLYADGLSKRRFMFLPAAATVDPRAADGPYGRWDLAPGSVLLKEFWLGHPQDPTARPVETRILARRAGGDWVGYTYLWLEDGTDAELMPDAPRTVRLAFPQPPLAPRPVDYELPARTGDRGCTRCHTPTNGFVLGPSLANLNRAVPWRGGLAPQLEVLGALGVWRVPPDLRRVPAGANPENRAAPITERVRHFLHVNCSHCHGGGGERADLPFGPPDVGPNRLAELCRVANPRAVGVDGFALSPLYRRDTALGRGVEVGAMPPLGRSTVSLLNQELLETWFREQAAIELCQQHR